MNRGRMLNAATWMLVAGIAALAFLASFHAISDYAVKVGAFPPELWWVPPMLVDAVTLVAAGVILARSRDGARAVYAWTLVAAASAVSVALNVAHAPDTLAARLVSSLPPIALLASLELVMSEARRVHGGQRQRPPQDSKRKATRPVSTPPASSLDGERPGGVANAWTAREVLEHYQATHPDEHLTAAKAAEVARISRSRAGQLLKESRTTQDTDSREDAHAGAV